MLYLCALHYEHITEHSVQETTVPLGAAHAALRYNYVSSVRRVTLMMGLPTKASFSISLSKASFPLM